MRWILRLVQDFYRFVRKIGSDRDGRQSVPRTKVTLNVTPRGRSEVFSASTRSKKYSLFVIWHHRECHSPPYTSLFLTLPYTSFRFPLESLSKPLVQRGWCQILGGEWHSRWCQITNNEYFSIGVKLRKLQTSLSELHWEYSSLRTRFGGLPEPGTFFVQNPKILCWTSESISSVGSGPQTFFFKSPSTVLNSKDF